MARAGLEPGTAGLRVRRADHLATLPPRQIFSLFLRAHCPFLCSWNKCKYDQWWEVKFVGEGIIDQGGGFRDSLAELADELCPLDENVPEILPYLIRTPNQKVLSLKHHTL